jgi:hypothetical protein
MLSPAQTWKFLYIWGMSFICGLVLGYFWAPGGNEYTKRCCDLALHGAGGRIPPILSPEKRKNDWLYEPARQASVPKLPGNPKSQSKPPSAHGTDTVSGRLLKQRSKPAPKPAPAPPATESP